jgi:DNA-binding XRE family transcriptional regulator
MDDRYKFREFIFEEMKKRDMSARQFAEFLGVTHDTVNRMLTHKEDYLPSIDTAIKVGEKLGINPAVVLTLAYPDLDFSITGDQLLFSERFNKAPKEIQNAVKILLASTSS